MQSGWATPVVEFVLCYLLMGTENIGIQIEEPFCIMPLSVFCAGCEASVVEIMECCERELLYFIMNLPHEPVFFSATHLLYSSNSPCSFL